MTRHTTRLRSRAAAVAAVATAVLALGGLSAATAQAAPQSAGTRAAPMTTTTGFFTAGGVNIRSGPSTAYTILGQGQQGQAVYIYCEAPGDWYHILDRATGVNGWSYWPDNILIDSLSPNPPGC
ncbi:SH3 domain-containing protein [Streptomyces sp. CA2R106]|uniref:SH3 domain-containing protein n=1 Tax=Streptomyces sp. CA2R106 TaxID=3120153 RepID=UPI00300BF255